MLTEFSASGTTAALKIEPGLHQFRWDMRHEGVWDKDAKKSGRSGPLVAPGEYMARFKVNGKTFHETFRIDIDPKVAASGTAVADLTAQEYLNLRVRDLRTKAKQTLNSIQESKRKIKAGGAAKMNAQQKQQVEALVKLANQFLSLIHI